MLRATLRQSLHDFDGALADLSRVLDADPRNLQAWLTRGIILQVQGKFEEAIDSCLRLRGGAQRLVVTTCLTASASRNGRAGPSYEQLRDLFEQSPDTDPGIRLWVLTILGEVADALGKTGAAIASSLCIAFF